MQFEIYTYRRRAFGGQPGCREKLERETKTGYMGFVCTGNRRGGTKERRVFIDIGGSVSQSAAEKGYPGDQLSLWQDTADEDHPHGGKS